MNEESNINFKKAKKILGYIFLFFNIIIIFISSFLLQSKTKSKKMLKLKLFIFIILDSISVFLFDKYGHIINPIVSDILIACLSSIEFYIFLSFIYQIYNNTEISVLAKKIVLIDPLHLSFLFLFVIFSYHKYSQLFKIINTIENIIILCCIILLYRYLRNITKTIRNNLLPRDIESAYVFYSLRMLNSICFLLMVCYYGLKLIIIYSPERFQLYINIALEIIKFGLKYSIFVIFGIIIYLFNKNLNINIKNNNEENDKIIFAQVID